MHWIYILITPDDRRDSMLEITGAKYHHLARVRRVQAGALLRAAQPDGRVFSAEVTDVTAECVRARITGEADAVGQSPCRITLCQAVLKGEKMELVVQKASELGVAVLAPLLARRSVPRWTAAQAVERAQRWQRIADAAAEQCERSIPLQVAAPGTLCDTLGALTGASFLLHERDGRPLSQLAGQYPDLRAVNLYVGPEGGWDEHEVSAMRDAGVIPIHLGGRILRAETAGLVAATLAQYLWGDLGQPSLEG